MIQQLAIGQGLGCQGRHIGAGAIRAVNRAKYRVRALGVLEALLQVRLE